MAIQSGTLVWLKSGGPKMTVRCNSNKGWICTWFLNYEPKEYTFLQDQLTESDPSK